MIADFDSWCFGYIVGGLIMLVVLAGIHLNKVKTLEEKIHYLESKIQTNDE